MDARKDTYGQAEAFELAKKATTIITARGKSVSRTSVDDPETGEEQLIKAMLGPTGNLRAPTIRVGKTLVVGFSEDVYSEVLGV